MPNKIYNRIIIPSLTISREGRATGEAVTGPHKDLEGLKKDLEGLEEGSKEYEAAIRNIIQSARWTRVISQWDPIGFSSYLEALFAQSASEILIASPDQKKFDASVENLPLIARKRIKYAKKETGNAYELVRSFFLPIVKDLSQRGLYDPKKSEPEPKNPRLNSHPIVSLASEIYLLALAVAYKSQVDWNLIHVKSVLSTLRGYLLSTDSQTRLSMIEGLLNLYIPNEIEGFIVSPDYKDDSLGERLFALLNDAAYLDLSHEKHQLGFRKRRSVALHQVSVLSKEIQRSGRWKGLLDLTKQVIMLFSPVKLPTINLLQMFGIDRYSPSLANLKALKIEDSTQENEDRAYLIEAVGDANFVDEKIKEGTLKMKWYYYTDEIVPDFSFQDEL